MYASAGSSSTSLSKKGKGKEVAVEGQVPPLAEEVAAPVPAEEGERPEWLSVLPGTNFWDLCEEHAEENRAEKCMFCLHCYHVSCPHCRHDDELGHRLLKVRRYVYRSVVLVKDMQDLGIDVSRVQGYVINQHKVVHLRPMKRSKLFKPQAGAPRCLTCGCWLHTAPNLFCSLVCEGKLDISQDDFSGPEAERRYRSLQTNMLPPQPYNELPEDEEQEEDELANEAPASDTTPEASDALYYLAANAEPRQVSSSFRRRSRKQAAPVRAPFF